MCSAWARSSARSSPGSPRSWDASRLALALRDANLLRAQARADAAGDPAKWHATLAAANRAGDLVGPFIDAPARSEVLALQREVSTAALAADRDATLLRTVFEIR